jgi:phosphatidylglycerophosphate synthase
MPQYKPTSRRPIADAFRRTADLAVRICLTSNISPDAISYASIIGAAVAAICFWKSSHYPALLIVAPLLCLLRLWFNMLDGMVAVAGGTASLRGEIVNDLPDRVSDVIIFAGVAHSGWMHHPILAYWAAILALLTAYVGLFGQAIGAGRQFGGLMSKPWRMVALAVGSWMTWVLQSSVQSMNLFTIFDWICLLIIGGCIQTMVIRLKRIVRALPRDPR